MKSAALIVLAFLALVVQSTLSVMLPIESWIPSVLLPATIYLGVNHRVHLVRGAVLVFFFGFLWDSFGGSPMGIHTFVLEATFVLSRVAGLRLLVRGQFSQVVLTFVVAMLVGGTSMALQAIFEPAPPFQVNEPWKALWRLTLPSLTTAVIAPLVFLFMGRLENYRGRRSEEAGAAR